MKKLIATTAAAIFAVAAAPVSAATVIDVSSGTGAFSAVKSTPGNFVDHYEFTIPVGGNVGAAQVTTLQLGGADIDFSSIMLDSHSLIQTGFDPSSETWELSGIVLTGGLHTLTIAGVKLGAATRSYGGTIELAGVPEPAAWGMMLLGFGLVGSSMRSRKGKTTVVYA